MGASQNTDNRVTNKDRETIAANENAKTQQLKIKVIIQYWIQEVNIKLGWINNFDKIVAKYVNKVTLYSSSSTFNLQVVGFTLLKILKGHENVIRSVKFSPDGSNIVSSSRDNTVRIWDVGSGKQIQTFREDSGSMYTAKFSPDGHNVLSCSYDGTIRLWDIASGKQIQVFKGHFSPVNIAEFSPDGRTIISCALDTTIRLWSTQSGIEMMKLEGHSDIVWCAHFSQMVNIFNIGIWDVKSGKRLQQSTGHSDSIRHVNFSPDGQFIVSCSSDKTIRIWDVISGREVKNLQGHSSNVNIVIYFPDGQTIVSGSDDKTIRIWDVKSGKEIQKLEGHSASVRSIDVSPDELLQAQILLVYAQYYINLEVFMKKKRKCNCNDLQINKVNFCMVTLNTHHKVLT
ncbi:G-protein beta WD-40 repeats containing protein [Reticulomyxa filosa]|uniref:G-protein beta WD-40 repeats containing protein n=1 Tax=Reticulomyxa filosa TaxID=46433 RepID=X6PDQ1_RETFI|nr:G-protein beta WD-40 repeats containing protein [Reticulomyxa filosa]|eukprot:ETO36630.1 G-protein beta WD-40 repeats containing protein [Reticulomyxa filosa]